VRPESRWSSTTRSAAPTGRRRCEAPCGGRGGHGCPPEVTVAAGAQERGTRRLDTQLPVHARWGLAPRSHPAAVNAMEVVPDAHRDAVVTLVSAAAGAEEEVMVV